MADETSTSKPVLFSLEQCIKCQQVKELIPGSYDMHVVTFPHDFQAWSEDEIDLAERFGVLDDLRRTAPILVMDDKKIVGYLRIRKWLQEFGLLK